MRSGALAARTVIPKFRKVQPNGDPVPDRRLRGRRGDSGAGTGRSLLIDKLET